VQRDARILFIGNSFTARNDLPGMVAALAAARGISVEHELITAGGASLRRHWNKGDAQARIERADLTHVVLQEQSTLPIKNRVRFHQNVGVFAPIIKAAGATLVLYQTWARRHAPETQVQLSRGYAEIGREVGGIIVPAGDAWALALAQHVAPVLHARDGSHPTLAGSYLAACCFFCTLFGDSPPDIPLSLDASARHALAEVAVSIARDAQS